MSKVYIKGFKGNIVEVATPEMSKDADIKINTLLVEHGIPKYQYLGHEKSDDEFVASYEIIL